MPATCSNNMNPPEEDPLPHPTRCHCSRGEQCDCGNGRFLSLLTSSSSFGRSYQEDSKPMTRVSNKEHSDHLLYQSDCTSARNYASLGLIIQRNSHDPLFVATIRTKASCINPPNLNSFHTYNQNEFSSGTRTTLVLGSAPLRQFSPFQSLFRLPNILLRSLWPAILPSYASVDTPFRLGQASASSDENALHNEASQIDLWRQLIMEWTLHMHRLADSSLEESTSFFAVSANHGVHNFRLMAENAGVTYQQPLHFSIAMRNNRYGSMWLDVDNMSYEELLDLEDHIGYVSTGISEEAACVSIKRSNYFLFAEDNAQKDFCTICQEDFAEEDELGTLDCGHGFHILCIKQWLGYKNACPICKSPGLDTTCPSFSLSQSP